MEYTRNECVMDNRPALRPKCKEWDKCRSMIVEDEVLSVEVAARIAVDSLNQFTGGLTWRSCLFLLVLMLVFKEGLKALNTNVYQQTPPINE